MSKNKTIILLITIAVIVVGLVGFKYIFRPTNSSVEGSKTDIKINASDLLLAFENDEQEANTLYLDKIVEVSGRIDSVEDDSFISVTIKNSDDISGIICSFDKNTISSQAFTIGDHIQVKGNCTGYLMDVILVKCVIVN